jgi:hypothetical protein
MPRYHVHCVPTDPSFSGADIVITVSLDAANDQMAELCARAMLTVGVDVQEIEEEE